ncbi:MAG: GntR family transcriptional regulator [Candidatus Sulfopaludibacter sp.]|nr:GntR family transcriptional regulator [Candidatus Sulfopaludibacter sp.]
MQAADARFTVRLEALSSRLGRRAPMANQIAETIRDMIVAGELNPGDRIVESRFAREIGVGQPTVREALVALEHEGLVVRKANQGCVVTTLTRAEIGQILRIREELETLAMELAIENAADAQIRKLLLVTDAMERAGRARDVREFFGLDVRFHETLWRLSGNSLLPRLLAQALMPLLAFLFIRNLRNHQQIDMKDSASAHVELAEAILSRDKELARRVARAKFRMFAEDHLQWFEEGR